MHMTTVRHLERLWNAGSHQILVRDLLSGRPEGSLRLQAELSSPVAVAALVLIRLDELAQSHVPLYSRLLKMILAAAEGDGGWGDPLISALCLRALLAGRGAGVAIDRGLESLAQLQRPEGLWPATPLRRMPAEPFVSAFILLQLGGDERFRAAVRFRPALQWFERNTYELDPETRRLWDHAAVRCRTYRAPSPQHVLSWS
jgi:hypothetical protein